LVLGQRFAVRLPPVIQSRPADEGNVTVVNDTADFDRKSLFSRSGVSP